MVDLATCRGAYDSREIDNVGWMKSSHRLADGLKKLDKP